MITMDMEDDSPAPARGDRLRTERTTYYVLHSRQVKRRYPNATRRYALKIAKLEDLPDHLRGMLIQSAIRNRGASVLYKFRWHPRTKKKLTFEQYIRKARP